MYTWANVATLLRVACVIGMLRHVDNAQIVFWLAVVGGMSDAVDGWLAKWRGPTKFGAYFDQYADWSFGVVLLYAVWHAEGFQGHNVPLATLLAGYLLWRAFLPLAETNMAAKTKTAMQFCGAVTILGGHAYWEPLVLIGYAVLWTSMMPMYVAFRAYARRK